MHNLLSIDLDCLALEAGKFLFPPFPSTQSQEIISKENGYAIRCYDGRTSIFVCFKPGYRGYASFCGTIKKSEFLLSLDSTSTVESIQKLFQQPPIEQWRDESEINVQFTQNGLHFEFSWSVDPDNTLNYLIIEYNNMLKK